MEISSFGLRQIAYAYCQFVLAHFGGIDRYQLALFTVLLAFLGGVAFLTNERARPNAGRLVPPWLYGLLLVLALFLIRLPTFLAGEMNPDESMLLAGAMKLRHYPVFWRSLNGGTSGPLNFYALTVLNILGFPLDYATAHFMNVLCIGGTIAVAYGIAHLFMDDWIARLTPLPLLAAAMAFRSPDFLHDSSECLPVFLIAAATWMLMADVSQQPNRLREIGIGVLVVLIPLAKLQAGPMAAVIAIAGVAHAFLRRPDSRWRRSVYIAAGFAGGMAVFLSLLALLGAFHAFERSYIAANLIYANEASAASFKDLLLFLVNNGDFKWYEGGIFGFLLCAACAGYLRASRGSETWLKGIGDRFSFHDLVTLLLLAASLYSIYRPHILFRHYLMFLIFPVSLLGIRTMAHLVRGAPAASAHSRQKIVWPVMLFVFGALVVPGLARGRDTMLAFNSEAWMAAEEGGVDCAPCQVVSYFAKAGDPITVWGWVPEVFVRTHTVPATRDVVTYWQMMPSLLRDSFRRTFLGDLQKLPPQLFVDAVGPGQFVYQDRKRWGYETFPELRDYVNSNFDLVGDIDGVRVFARKGTQRQVTVPFRMNAGGGSVSDEAGKAWNADAYFSNSPTRRFQPDAAIGKLPALYQSERICARECRYLIPIQNGSYLVRMFFAERDYAGANQRVFNVAVDDDACGLGHRHLSRGRRRRKALCSRAADDGFQWPARRFSYPQIEGSRDQRDRDRFCARDGSCGVPSGKRTREPGGSECGNGYLGGRPGLVQAKCQKWARISRHLEKHWRSQLEGAPCQRRASAEFVRMFGGAGGARIAGLWIERGLVRRSNRPSDRGDSIGFESRRMAILRSPLRSVGNSSARCRGPGWRLVGCQRSALVPVNRRSSQNRLV